MEIILRGEPREIDFVIRLCRDKVRRGMLSILPATLPADGEPDEVETCDPATAIENNDTPILQHERMDDTKDIAVEDSKNVVVGTDTKSMPPDDSKDISAAEDSKKLSPGRKTSKRTKK